MKFLHQTYKNEIHLLQITLRQPQIQPNSFTFVFTFAFMFTFIVLVSMLHLRAVGACESLHALADDLPVDMQLARRRRYTPNTEAQQ